MTVRVSRNPFTDIRVEATIGPRLLSRHHTVVQLEAPRNSLLIGSRGSGKTSALLCLDWAERAHNISLIKELNGEPLGFIAVYSKVHHHISSTLRAIPWHRVVGEEAAAATAAEYFSTLIELLAAEQLISSVIAMRGEDLLRYEFDGEKTAARSIFEIVTQSHFQEPVAPFEDLAACATWCRDTRLSLHRAGARNRLEAALDALPDTRPGRFLNTIATILHRLVTHPTHANGLLETFHFKVCFDEAETLSPEQQIYLNSIVRTSEAPLFWVVATVDRTFEATETTELGQSLTSADRQVIYLDGQRTDQDFKEFAKQIVSLRVRNALGCYKTLEPTEYDDVTVEFARLLDLFSVNTAISRLIGGSHSRFTEQLREWASELDKEVLEPLAEKAQKNKKKQAPEPRFYEAYLLRKLFPDRSYRDIVPNNVRERKNWLAGLRRKQYGALLCIVREGRFQYVPYYGDRSLLNLADGNIRELLEIMGSLYDAAVEQYGEDALLLVAGRLGDRRISWSLQRKAFERASASKLNGIANRHAEIGGSVSKLINCFGQLTYLLQTDIEGVTALRTPERGNFEFRLEEVSSTGGLDRRQVIDRTREVVDRCIEDSLLKEVGSANQAAGDDGSRIIYQVRVHQRFAPLFKTSIRGAYETLSIPANAVAEVCIAPADIDAEEWAKKVYTNLKEQWDDNRQAVFSWSNQGERDDNDWLSRGD
jgi:hypothetical protein